MLLSIRLTEIVCKRTCAKGATAERHFRNIRYLSRELAHADAPLVPEGFTLTSARLAFDYKTCEGCRKTARLLPAPS